MAQVTPTNGTGMWVAATTYDGAVYGWSGDPFASSSDPAFADAINAQNALPFRLVFATGAHTKAGKTAAFSMDTGKSASAKVGGKARRARKEFLVTGGSDETLRSAPHSAWCLVLGGCSDTHVRTVSLMWSSVATLARC